MLYPYLVQCPTPWKRHSQPSRSVTTPGELWFFPPGTLDELPHRPERDRNPCRSQLRHFLLFVALACSIRITSVITWAFLFPPLFWQLSRNPTLLRAFITDTISAAYVYERLSLHPIYACVFQVCCLLPALHTRQCIQRRADTDTAQLSPCQRFVGLTLLWLCTVALLHHPSLPITSRAYFALRPARRLPCFNGKPTTSKVIALYCDLDERSILMRRT
jgi:hypothetical protein